MTKTLEELKQTIAQNTIVVLYFTGTHCTTCHKFMPILKKLESDKNITVLYIDETSDPDCFSEFEIHSVPLALFIKSGKEFTRRSIIKQRDVEAIIHRMKAN